MFLFINNLAPSQIVIGLNYQDNFYWLKQNFLNNRSREILPLLDQILKKKKQTIKDLKGIIVVNGPGSFAGIRKGLAVANTLGWALNIIIQGISQEKTGENDKLFKQGIKKILDQKNQNKFSPVKPFYGGNPHIGRAKSISS
jgi:tRNA A37 threonylcarbamoyladenosine modification protein TsaB